MKEKILLSILLLTPLIIFSQEIFFSFEEAKYTSPLEQRILSERMVGKGNVLDAFLIIAPEDSLSFESWNKKFENKISELKQRKVPKKFEKDVKNIYDELHESFLRKYENLAFMDQIFERGIYNCVTAVAVYAMAFDALNIPYTIKETPTHVYIVADPENSQLLIETTDPIGGFKSFSPGFKESYVVQLGMMKLVDQNDIAEKGIYPVFEEFYFGGADLSLNQLVGIQYYNLAVSLFNDRKYSEALDVLVKVQLFHSNDQIDEVLFATIANILASSSYEDWNDIRLLPYLTRFKSFDVNNSNIVGEFSRMLNIVLTNNNNVVLADSAYQHFIALVDDQYIIEEVSFNYYYEKARLSYNRAKYTDAFQYSAQAYNYKPGNENTEMILIESFRISNKNESSEEALSQLDTILAKSPDLKKNNKVLSLKLNLLLDKMAQEFNDRKSKSGGETKALFEQMIKENPNLLYDSYLLGEAYSNAAVFYFKRGSTSTARKILQEGLELAPNNYQLKSRLRMIRN